MNKLAMAGIALVAIAVVAVLFFRQAEPQREIVAFVNNDPIYRDEINTELTTLTPEDRQFVTETEVLSFVIDKKLLLQAAEANGTQLTQAQRDRALQKVDEHAQYNLSEDAYRERLLDEARINAFLNDQIITAFIAQSEEVHAYYEQVYAPQNISFEDAETRIISELADKRHAQEREAYIAQLRERANIKIV